MDYEPTIGLEIHAELKTKTKMFCGCPNKPDTQKANVNVCPVCLGHPGVLPVINKKAVEFMIKIGMALGSKISPEFKFDRKNYFYPDLPKGYQISQFDLPIAVGGELNGVKITRVHLEEDAARLVHGPSPDLASGEQYGSSDAQNGSERLASTLVDFNRGGVPLMELVTEPVIKSSKEASDFAKELQLVLRYLEVSDADLEKGHMRADANISIGKDGKLGTRVEIKNINSFSAVEAAINYEIERQKEVLEGGGRIEQETRGWDDIKKQTKSQRSKEEAHDYRYFPEPDLPPLLAKDFDLENIKLSLPELPKEKRERFKQEYNLDSLQAGILVTDRHAAAFFEKTISEFEADENKIVSPEKIKLVFNYFTSDLWGIMKELNINFYDLKINPENFADLVEMTQDKEISSRTAKDLLKKMAETGGDPRVMVKESGLGQVSNEGELLEVVRKIISENPVAVADYKKGKIVVVQFMVGKAMGALKGRGNPGVLCSLFEKELKV